MNFENDKEGIKFFSNYLIKKGFYNIQTTTTFTSWDLEAEKDGIVYYFELKVRPKVALDGKWNDSICEQNKLEHTPSIEHSYLVNLFTDCFTIIPYTAQHKVQKKYCRKTTNWNRTPVLKNLLSYPNLPKYIRQYE